MEEALDVPMRAAPTPKPVTVNDFAHFIAMLEDGVLKDELSEQLQQINAEMNNHAQAYGAKAKGRLTLTIDFELNKGVFDIQADYSVKLPKAKRARSVAWSTPDNRFTPQNPRQMQLFGARDVTSASRDDIRNV